MKVIVDNKIPYIKGLIETLADEVIYLPGKDFTPEVVKEADALIIRTRTLCNRQLLEGSKVQFIGTATIGFDHIDTKYCQEAGITWSNCPGCNAGAVEQYVHAALLLLQQEKGLQLKGACLGIVGVGHVGECIRRMAERIGMKVLLNDPPRADAGEQGFTSLDTLAEQCDILTFHTPLIREGKYQTFHLADRTFFQKLQRRPYLLNTSRGEVVETEALLEALDTGTVTEAVIDVWENEPHISQELLNKVFIGTPHIAGYSADGKANATRMVLKAFCHFFHKPSNFHIVLPTSSNAFSENENLRILQLYNPLKDYETLRTNPEHFEQLRGDYPLRRE
ncbi:MAG: 4-phosphoerythronate dehydrogenase PdxB [Candidatus Phocaeicola merdigallinarum]|nr:4-phosphoerythronate dehydrogenase PdxB [Candidatus Phocaeicola merdigallinarum]